MTFINLVPPIYYNVKQYGAMGDGVTDDTAALLAWIGAASAAGGGTLYAGPGSYIYSSDLALPSNVCVLGAGRGTTFRVKAGTTANGFKVSGSSHVTLRNLQMDWEQDQCDLSRWHHLRPPPAHLYPQ